MGGFLSVPSSVRTPVVKKMTAAYSRNSLESKSRPSLLAVSSKLLASEKFRRAVSIMLGLPFSSLIAACSKPDDFVNRSTFFLLAANDGRATSSPRQQPRWCEGNHVAWMNESFQLSP